VVGCGRDGHREDGGGGGCVWVELHDAMM
jgi:hypothetical protein